MDIGKTAISIIFYKLEQDNPIKENNWYDILWSYMNDKAASVDKFGDNKIAIITYNYERSLEYYLFRSIQSLYGSESENITNIKTQLSKIKVIHLHGQIGYLDWQKQNNYDVINPYGGIKYPTDLDDEERKEQLEEYYIKIDKISKGIKIIHEDISNNEDYIQALKLLDDAEKIYF